MTERNDPRTEAEGSNRELAVIGLLVAVVLAVYYRTAGFDFINLDDNLYVYENEAVLSGLNWESIRWAFTTFYSANWHPLTWLSLMTDVSLFGPSPGGHHAVNVLIHLANSILAFMVIRLMTARFWPSAVVAVLFAVHPTHVESVAWISERKDLLSTLFMLLSIGAYAYYVRFESHKRKAFRVTPYYAACFILFALGLMAKPMLVTLPFVFLLFDYWPFGRLNKFSDLKPLLIEKIPFFILTIASSIVTIAAQRSVGAFESFVVLPIETRIANAITAAAAYVFAMFYPAGLVIYYPHPLGIQLWPTVATVLFLILVTAVCIWLRSSNRYLLTGWLFFLGTLVPVIGIVQVGAQAMADRYTYVPYFGLFIMLAFGVDTVFQKRSWDKKIYIGTFAAAAVALAFVSYVQVGYWKNSETIYRRTLALTRNNFLISHNLCLYLAMRDRLGEAEPFCNDSKAINPNWDLAYNTLGIIRMKQERYEEAEAEFTEYVKRAPSEAVGYSNLSLAQIKNGKPYDAEANLRTAAFLDRGSVSSDVFMAGLKGLAATFEQEGNYQKALEALYRQQYLMPDDVAARYDAARILFLLKRSAEAREQAEVALNLRPGDAEAHNLLGKILLELGQKAQAIESFSRAIEIRPDHPEASENLKKARGEK